MKQAEACAAGAVQMAQATKTYMDEILSREKKKGNIYNTIQQAHTTRKKDLQQGRELEGAAAVKPESEAKKKGETAKDKGATPEKTQRKADASGISSDGAAAAVTEAKAPPSPTSDANRTIVNTGRRWKRSDEASPSASEITMRQRL